MYKMCENITETHSRITVRTQKFSLNLCRHFTLSTFYILHMFMSVLDLNFRLGIQKGATMTTVQKGIYFFSDLLPKLLTEPTKIGPNFSQ